MKRLNRIIRKGTRMGKYRNNWIRCRDGFTFSAIANWGAYCQPRPAYCFNESMDVVERHFHPCGQCQPDGFFEQANCGYRGPFTHLEVGFPSLTPEPWKDWEQYFDGSMSPTSKLGTDGIYAYVPVELVRRLIIKHGGEKTHEPYRTKRKRRVEIRWTGNQN